MVVVDGLLVPNYVFDLIAGSFYEWRIIGASSWSISDDQNVCVIVICDRFHTMCHFIFDRIPTPTSSGQKTGAEM